MFTTNILWIVFPTFVFSLQKVLEGALRFLAQVLDRFDIGTTDFFVVVEVASNRHKVWGSQGLCASCLQLWTKQIPASRA